MSTCETCGHDFTRANASATKANDRFRQYRRALMIACGQSHEKMRAMMLQAEDELFSEPANESEGKQ